MISLTNQGNKSCLKQKVCHICKKEFSTDDDNGKYNKIRYNCRYTSTYRGVVRNIRNGIKQQNKFLQYFIIVLNITIIL